MYFPYIRGKQYELICIRESAQRMAESGILPIIEPVRSNFSGLNRAIVALVDKNVRFVLVITPDCGDLDGQPMETFDEVLNEIPNEYEGASIGYIIS